MKYIPPYGSSDPDAPYVDRNSSTGTSGSKVPAKAIEIPMRELVDLITKSGITPDEVLQLSRAIRRQRLNWFIAAGTANVLMIAPDPAFATLADLVGVPLRMMIATTNTGPATLNVNGLGAVAIVSATGDPIVAGDLRGICELVYDGANFRMVSASPQSVSMRALAEGSYSIAAGGLPNTIITGTLLGSQLVETFDNANALSAGVFTVPFNGVLIATVSTNSVLELSTSAASLGLFLNGDYIDGVLDNASLTTNRTMRITYSKVMKVSKGDTVQFSVAWRNAAGTGNGPAMTGNATFMVS